MIFKEKKKNIGPNPTKKTNTATVSPESRILSIEFAYTKAQYARKKP
jgi:hypothetical protein